MKVDLNKSSGSISYFNVVGISAPQAVPAKGSRGSKAKRTLVVKDANGDTLTLALFAKDARSLKIITRG